MARWPRAGPGKNGERRDDASTRPGLVEELGLADPTRASPSLIAAWVSGSAVEFQEPAGEFPRMVQLAGPGRNLDVADGFF